MISLIEAKVSEDEPIQLTPTAEDIPKQNDAAGSSINILIDLPTDLTLNVLKYWLSLRDIAKIDSAMINRSYRTQWIQVLEKSVITLGTVNIREKELTKLKWLNLRSAYCSKLAYRNCKIRDTVLTEPMLKHWECLGKHLKCLRFKERCSVVTPLMLSLVSKCTRLEELYVSCKPMPSFNGSSLRVIADRGQNLRNFYISEIFDVALEDWQYFAEQCPNITEFSVDTSSFAPLAIPTILDSMKNLTKLLAKNCTVSDPMLVTSIGTPVHENDSNYQLILTHIKRTLEWRLTTQPITAHTKLMSIDCSHSKYISAIILPYLVQRCPLIERMNISFCSLDSATFRILSQSTRRIKTLFMPGCTIDDDLLINLVSQCHVIETLVLGYTPTLTEKACVAMARHLPNLKTFALWGNQKAFNAASMKTLAMSCNKIDKIALTHTTIDDATLVTLVQHCKISRIEINGCLNVTDAWMPQLSANCHEQLTHFVAEQVKVTDDGCLELSKCQKLEYLNLSSVERVTNAGLLSILTNCKNINVLRLKQCKWVTNETLAIIAEHGHNIRELDLSSNELITAAGILDLVTKSQRLHRLFALNCLNLNMLVESEMMEQIAKVAARRRTQFTHK